MHGEEDQDGGDPGAGVGSGPYVPQGCGDRFYSVEITGKGNINYLHSTIEFLL